MDHIELRKNLIFILHQLADIYDYIGILQRHTGADIPYQEALEEVLERVKKLDIGEGIPII